MNTVQPPYDPQMLAEILTQYGLQGFGPDAYTIERYAPRAHITMEGKDISALRIVLAGRAKTFRSDANGKPLILCRYISDGVIGELELLTDQSAATSTVTAITDFDCLAISFTRCREELTRNLAFSNRLARVLAAKLNSSAANYTASTLVSGEQRLWTYLMMNANDGFFCEPLTDVAGTLGMSYRHLERLLSALVGRGVLAKEKHGFRICSFDPARRSIRSDGGCAP